MLHCNMVAFSVLPVLLASQFRPRPGTQEGTSLDTIKTEWLGNIRNDVLAAMVVALALIPEAIAFSIIAGVDPKVGLYASFCIAVVIAFTGGRPGMISAATGAMALVLVPLGLLAPRAAGPAASLACATNLLLAMMRDDGCEQALLLNPRWVDALSGKAQVLNATGNSIAAEQQFKLAIELEPGYWQNYMLYGGFLYEAGHFKAAARNFERAAQLKPGSTDVLNSLAAAWFFSGQFTEAVNAWQQVVDLSPVAQSYSNLGTAHYFNGDYANAEQQYRQALSNSADDYTIWTNLADVLDVQTDRQQEALPLYQKALQLAERNLLVDAHAPALLSQISRLQAELQLCEMAAKTAEKVEVGRQTDFYLFYDLAITSFNCQQHEKGVAYVRQAIDLGYPAELIAADPKIPHSGL